MTMMTMPLQWQQTIRRTLRQREHFIRNAGAATILFVGADAVAQVVEIKNNAKDKNAESKTCSSSAQAQSKGSDQDGALSPGMNSIRRHLAQLDHWRCMGAALLGIILGGGVYPTAYAQLDRFLPGKSWRTVILKSALEIATVGIAVNMASLLGRASWQGTHSWQAVATHCWHEIPRVTFVDAHVWFPYNLAAFGLIPIQIRPLTTACMEAGWQTYISLRAHDYQQKEEGREEHVDGAGMGFAVKT